MPAVVMTVIPRVRLSLRPRLDQLGQLVFPRFSSYRRVHGFATSLFAGPDRPVLVQIVQVIPARDPLTICRTPSVL